MGYLKYDGAAAVATADAVLSNYGQSGAETMVGTTAPEAFWMNAGDVATGGLGDDTYWLQALKSQVSITELAGGGTDKIAGWQNLNLADFPNIENVYVGGDKTYGAGNAGDNIVEGGAGSQQLYGGGGQDVLIGGAGADTFIVKKGEGNDVIQDFSASEDKVRLSAGYTTFDQVKAHMTQVGSDVKLDLGGADGLIFRNITVGQFTASNFELQLDASKLGAMTFHDEFSGQLSIWDAESNPTGTWRTDFGYQGSQGLGSYTLASNDEKEIYISPYFRDHNGDFQSPFTSNADGTLTITAKPSTSSEIFGYNYTSGLITTQPTFAQTYGYFEMRAELPHADGAWPAFWLLPADGSWPPELDVMETLTSDPNADWTTAHSGVGGHTSNGGFAFIPDTADGFHTYGALWTPTDIVWYVDGVEVFHTATPADMNKPMYMLANLALGGWGGAIDNADLPAKMTIDYIRAYALGDGTSTGGSTGGDTSTPTTPSTPSTPGVVLTASAPGATLVGGAGADTINASQGADHLTGGAGADVFKFAAMPWSAGHITDFQLGVDKLDLSALYTSGYHGANPVADGYVTFVSDGAGGTKVMLDPDGSAPGQPWPFTIVTLDGIAPTGLTAAQVFNGAPVSPPPPPPPPVVAGVVLTSTTPGSTLTGGAGADTLNASQGADRLIGGAGADTFAFKAMPWSAGHIADFQLGVDKIDLSALYTGGYHGTDPVADGYVTFVSDGAGGTKVMLDPDGTNPAQPWPFTIVTLDGVSPTGLTAAQVFNGSASSAPVSPPPPPPPPPVVAGVVLTASTPASTLTGGAGADTLNASQGSDTLSGGAGADHFVFGALPWNAGHITDFQHGVDVLDLRPLFAAAGYHGSDPIADGYLQLGSDGNGGTVVKFDSDGPGNANPWPITITTLDHVAPSSLTSADWLFH